MKDKNETSEQSTTTRQPIERGRRELGVKHEISRGQASVFTFRLTV